MVTRSFGALALPDSDFALREVHVLHPQSAAFEQAEPAAVHEGCHEPGGAAEASENGGNLCPGEHLRYVVWPLGAGDLLEAFDVAVEHLTEQEQERAEGLILSRGRDSVGHRQPAQEACHVAIAGFAGRQVARKRA